VKKVLVTLAAVVGLSLLSPSVAHADSTGCTDADIDGLTTQFRVCMLINGDGTHVDRFRVGTDIDTDWGVGLDIGRWKIVPGLEGESGHDVPTIEGCEVHANVYNSDRSVNYNSPAISCAEADKRGEYYKLNKWDGGAYSGMVFEIPVDRDLPKGKYCGTLWFKMNGIHHSAGAACNQVKP
jgi:hypothetical protein